MANTTFSSSSMSLKIGFFVLFAVLIIHIVGYSIPRWVTLDMNLDDEHPLSEAAYHGGLWQHCACAADKYSDVCLCVSRSNDPGWFKTVQAAETLGLVGLILSFLLSAAMLCQKQNRRRKIANLIFVGMSGILISIGVVWFGINSMEPILKQLNRSAGHVFDGYTGHLSYAYILCAIAAFLSIFVCTPIFLNDLYASTQESYGARVYYTAQSQVHVPVQEYVPGDQQNGAYVPMLMQAHHGAPPQY